LKDAGIILAYTGIDKTSVVIDAGTGSGYLACFLARCAKKVYSFDVKESAVELGKKNAAFLELDNIEFAVGDVSQDIALPNCDAFILDMPNPQTCLNSVSKVLKSGGILACYLPCITQVITLVSALGEGYIHFKTVEVMEREWHVHEPKVRPISDSISHTAFLVFIRKI
jgi:tRNA (adenine57-N1/adenine58-N1)-methyltransferase